MKLLNKKRRKILWISLGSIFGVLIIGISLVLIFLEDIVSARLDQLLQDKFGTYYQMKFESIDKDINLSNASITINQVEFTTDTTDQKGLQVYPVIFFEAKRFEIKNISTWDILWGNALDIEEIKLVKPAFSYYERDLSMQVEVSGENFSKTALSEVRIDKLSLEDGRLAYIDFETGHQLFHNDSIRFFVKDFELDLNSIVDYQNAFKWEELAVEAYKASFIPLDGIYDFFMDSLRISYANGELELKDFKVWTKESILDASMNTVNQGEVINFDLERVKITGIDFDRLIQENELHIEKVKANTIEVDVFKNKLKGYESGFTKNIMNKDIRDVPFPILVDSVVFENTRIAFEIWNEKVVKPAKMSLTKMAGHITNFTTFKEGDDTMRIHMNGKIMDQGNLVWNLDFALQDSVSNYSRFSGYVQDLPFATMNPMIRNFLNIKVTKGHLERLDFVGRTDTWNSYGHVAFRYRDMDFDIYSLKDLSVTKRNTALSDLAKIALYKQNPLPNGQFRLADFRFRRMPHESSIMLWVGGILIGAVKTCVKDFVFDIVEDMTQKKIDEVLKKKGLSPRKSKIELNQKKKKKKKKQKK